jgi:hypothetical protein
MVFVLGVGFVTGIGLSLTVLLAMLLYMAAKLEQAADPESALIWQEAQSKGLKRRSDVHQIERSSRRVVETAPAATNA